MARYITVRAKTSEELQAFLQAIEWIDSPNVSIIDEDMSICEALICDSDSGYEDDLTINVNADNE